MVRNFIIGLHQIKCSCSEQHSSQWQTKISHETLKKLNKETTSKKTTCASEVKDMIVNLQIEQISKWLTSFRTVLKNPCQVMHYYKSKKHKIFTNHRDYSKLV